MTELENRMNGLVESLEKYGEGITFGDMRKALGEHFLVQHQSDQSENTAFYGSHDTNLWCPDGLYFSWHESYERFGSCELGAKALNANYLRGDILTLVSIEYTNNSESHLTNTHLIEPDQIHCKIGYLESAMADFRDTPGRAAELYTDFLRREENPSIYTFLPDALKKDDQIIRLTLEALYERSATQYQNIKEYNDISPYGGEDITYFPRSSGHCFLDHVDTLAISASLSPEFAQEIEFKAYDLLYEKDDTFVINEMIKQFEKEPRMILNSEIFNARNALLDTCNKTFNLLNQKETELTQLEGKRDGLLHDIEELPDVKVTKLKRFFHPGLARKAKETDEQAVTLHALLESCIQDIQIHRDEISKLSAELDDMEDDLHLNYPSDSECYRPDVELKSRNCLAPVYAYCVKHDRPELQQDTTLIFDELKVSAHFAGEKPAPWDENNWHHYVCMATNRENGNGCTFDSWLQAEQKPHPLFPDELRESLYGLALAASNARESCADFTKAMGYCARDAALPAVRDEHQSCLKSLNQLRECYDGDVAKLRDRLHAAAGKIVDTQREYHTKPPAPVPMTVKRPRVSI